LLPRLFQAEFTTAAWHEAPPAKPKPAGSTARQRPRPAARRLPV